VDIANRKKRRKSRKKRSQAPSGPVVPYLNFLDSQRGAKEFLVKLLSPRTSRAPEVNPGKLVAKGQKTGNKKQRNPTKHAASESFFLPDDPSVG
jgi:hypothetical protein